MHPPDDIRKTPKTPRWTYAVLIGASLVCVCVCFALLRHFTTLPLWLCVLFAFPLGLVFFYACIQIAEHS
jgi:hypothetical protein